ncbi:M15 family metallopeptidase [Spirulina major CS-329]|uniref:M15 family metallopeptidase n=1 Tax=Spirulina TaxID=1154 RepID=UPI002330C8CA|nr:MULTISPECIES: M15 family metallopeptidase [Spirulina]MDB9493491.1 M15 family metallopeptidase [Spirulina subsalsa CS-330]MDB9502584.1 M15 family metallopeptidase [Spirulina major CS-329]
MKPYQQIAIADCGEPLVPIPHGHFDVVSPHPYVKLGADYGGKSPYFLRSGVLEALQQAQIYLQQTALYSHFGLRLQIFDAYRPVAVQQFMVNYAYQELIRARSLDPGHLSPDQQAALWEEVHQFWAAPSLDPATPPPHSTGAAVDLSLVTDRYCEISMGGKIDEISPRSHPDYYATATTYQERSYHRFRTQLRDAMERAGFRQHPNEWWHFCLGDQMWVWLNQQDQLNPPQQARYGRYCEPKFTP